MRVVTAWYGKEDASILETWKKSASLNLRCKWEVLTPSVDSSCLDRFRAKIDAFYDVVMKAPLGEVLCLCDADLLFLEDLSEVEEMQFDVAFTPRPGPYYYNTGVVFIHVSEASKAFVEMWRDLTHSWGCDEQRIKEAKQRDGGTDQAAFRDTVDSFKDPSIPIVLLPLDYKVYNLCQDFENFGPQTKILHLKGKVHRCLLQGRYDEVPAVVVHTWRSFSVRKRWDEIVQRLPHARRVRVAELGVWRGALSSHLLLARKDLYLLMVDMWKKPALRSDYVKSGDTVAANPQSAFDAAKLCAMQIAASAPGRCVVIQGDSAVAVQEFSNRMFDLVFIDGDHSYEGASRDIDAWVPKVVVGGYIGGHDFEHPSYPNFGVARAVRERFEESRIERGEDHTWFVRITE